MQLAKKIRIYPTQEQVDVLWKLSEKCRIVYNFALADRQNTYEKEKKTKQKKGQNRSTQGLGNLGRFVQFLTYKAELIGKRVIRIDEKNTSKKCCYCGKKHEMPTWERVMLCDCGNNIDRDRNSSINIMIRYLSQNALWTGYQHFVDNLRQYRLPDGIEVLRTEAK